MDATTSRHQLLAEARRTWKAYIKSGADELAAARNATTAARKAGIDLREIHADQ